MSERQRNLEIFCRIPSSRRSSLRLFIGRSPSVRERSKTGQHCSPAHITASSDTENNKSTQEMHIHASPQIQPSPTDVRLISLQAHDHWIQNATIYTHKHTSQVSLMSPIVPLASILIQFHGTNTQGARHGEEDSDWRSYFILLYVIRLWNGWLRLPLASEGLYREIYGTSG